MATLTLTLNDDLRARLERLAHNADRSMDEVAVEAIETYLDLDDRQVEEIEKAIAEADAGGPFVPHEEVEAWVRSWGTDAELPRPEGTRS